MQNLPHTLNEWLAILESRHPTVIELGLQRMATVKERLGMLASYSGEKVLADVVRRLLNQNGLGNPPVQVVFLEPHDPAEACGHRLGESIRPLAYASAGAYDSCGCQ